MAAEIEKNPSKTGSGILKRISVLCAIYWIYSAWTEVEDTTIVKCFNEDGFTDTVFSESESDPCLSGSSASANCDINDNSSLAVLKQS